MFEIGKVRAAYDEKDQFLGIYACQIKPTSLLTSFLNENKRLGIIDLTTLEFHPIRQRAEKRLARYLSTQWFIRFAKNNLSQSFTIRTLVHEMNLGQKVRGTDLYERFIKALNELKDKEIVREWSFMEAIDFSKFGKKGWLPYFLELKIRITPSNEIIQKNKSKLSILKTHYTVNSTSIDDMLDSMNQVEPIEQRQKQPDQLELDLEEVAEPIQSQDRSLTITVETLTPEMVINERERRALSMLKASGEIGIGYNTLKRFENKQTKRRNKNNDQKLVKWLNKSLKMG